MNKILVQNVPLKLHDIELFIEMAHEMLKEMMKCSFFNSVLAINIISLSSMSVNCLNRVGLLCLNPIIFPPGFPHCYFLCSARRTKHDNHCKQRPVSEGVFNFSSLFGFAAPEASGEQRRASRFASADPWGAGRDLPSLLEQVSLKARRDAAGVSKDDTATLPPRRRINLFSSLRLRRRDGSVSDGPDQELQREIKTILTNLKNKGHSTLTVDLFSLTLI